MMTPVKSFPIETLVAFLARDGSRFLLLAPFQDRLDLLNWFDWFSGHNSGWELRRFLVDHHPELGSDLFKACCEEAILMSYRNREGRLSVSAAHLMTIYGFSERYFFPKLSRETARNNPVWVASRFLLRRQK